jgi:hypothetical protein
MENVIPLRCYRCCEQSSAGSFVLLCWQRFKRKQYCIHRGAFRHPLMFSADFTVLESLEYSIRLLLYAHLGHYAVT